MDVYLGWVINSTVEDNVLYNAPFLAPLSHLDRTDACRLRLPYLPRRCVSAACLLQPAWRNAMPMRQFALLRRYLAASYGVKLHVERMTW